MKHPFVLKSVDCWSGDYTFWKPAPHDGDLSVKKVLVQIVVASFVSSNGLLYMFYTPTGEGGCSSCRALAFT